MSDVGDVAGAIKSTEDLIGEILDRADRDALINELNEDLNKVQNSFANNNLDDQWVNAYKLLNDVGHPLTPGLVGRDGDREFKHHCLVSVAELKYMRKVVARLISQKLK